MTFKRAVNKYARTILDRLGLAVLKHHYYSPLVFPSDIERPLSTPRRLPGINFNVEKQLALLREFSYRDELVSIPMDKPRVGAFGYHNINFGPGDAEILYSMIRHFKPRRFVEVGCGYSTLVALEAEARNHREDPGYSCRHICIDPYEQPWLETLGVEVVRERIERINPAVVESLDENDFLFIDSSHVTRPQGDVVHEYLFLLGILRPGVVVHTHDIFTPRDYPEEWVLGLRRLWNEQYVLEAFLSFNSSYEILLMLNYLAHEHSDAVQNACPILAKEPGHEPGSFWFRRCLTI
jgi:predicted O-methyltransferase YrrM